MGYQCPVCGTPQADGEHLANHLAITALTHGEDHEDWLDEHATEWSDCSPGELADVVVEYAEETAHETVFEDTTPEHGRFEDALERQTNTRREGRGDLTDDAENVLEEARRLTERMIEDDEE